LKRLDSRFHGNDRKTNLRTFYDFINIDDLVKSLKRRIPVIPAKAGIQLFQILKNSLDSGFHRSDDFLRFHQYWNNGILE